MHIPDLLLVLLPRQIYIRTFPQSIRVGLDLSVVAAWFQDPTPNLVDCLAEDLLRPRGGDKQEQVELEQV